MKIWSAIYIWVHFFTLYNTCALMYVFMPEEGEKDQSDQISKQEEENAAADTAYTPSQSIMWSFSYPFITWKTHYHTYYTAFHELARVSLSTSWIAYWLSILIRLLPLKRSRNSFFSVDHCDIFEVQTYLLFLSNFTLLLRIWQFSKLKKKLTGSVP